MRIRARAGLVFLALAGCSGSGPSDPSELNILLNNQTGRRINVELTIGGRLQPGISINNGAFVTDEFSGGSPGQAITIKVTTNDGSPVLTATRSCTPKSTIFGGTEYGQIDFGGFDSGSILCQDPNTWEQ